MAGRHDTRRRFEQWVKNPTCEANVVSAVAGVEMATVATREGLTPTMGQSPFAIARGQTFERSLLASGGARLRDALIEKEVLHDSASGFLDLRMRQNGGPMPDLATAHASTLELLEQTASRGPTGLYSGLPALIASATLQIPGQPVMLPDGRVAIDALALRPAPDGRRVELVIGEIKTYPYRAGNTEAADLATTRAQAGVYLHALRLVIAELGLDDRLVACSDGFIVLTRTGRNDPSILPREQLEFQARRAARGFERLRAAASALMPFDPDDEALGVSKVQAADIAYSAECLGFCDRAAGCRRLAESRGDAAILGEDVRRFLGATPLPRAVELMNGAAPANDTERELVERIRGAAGTRL